MRSSGHSGRFGHEFLGMLAFHGARNAIDNSNTIQSSTSELLAMDEVPQHDMQTIRITAMTLSFAKRVSAYFPSSGSLADPHSVCELPHDLRDQANHQRQRDHEGRRFEVAAEEQGWQAGAGDQARQRPHSIRSMDMRVVVEYGLMSCCRPQRLGHWLMFKTLPIQKACECSTILYRI
jgi:hypothetical protein